MLTMMFSEDGTKLYILDGTEETMYEYDLATRGDPATAFFTRSYPFRIPRDQEAGR